MCFFSKINIRNPWLSWLAIFVILEILSRLAYSFYNLNLFFLAIIAVLAFILVWQKPIYALLLPLAELFWGSLGHSLSYGYFSLRAVIFLAVILSFGLHQLLSRGRLRIFLDKQLTSVYALVLSSIFLAFLVGYLRGSNLTNIFFDGNAYLYLLYLPVWYEVYRQEDLYQVMLLLKAAAVLVAIKTIIVFNVFVQNYYFLGTDKIYKWIRDTRTGEITPFGRGFFRVFFQSQFYLLLAWFYLLFVQLKNWKNKINFFWLSLISAALFISLSRSFWLGIAVALIFILINLGKYYRLRLSIVWALIGLASAVVSIFWVILFYNIPQYHGLNIFGYRTVDGQEPALSSRSQLWGPMWQAISDRPVLGYGFGQEITYQSDDPRIKNELNPEGWQTTYAFEWGWMDQLLKGGLVMIGAFLVWLWQLYRRGYKILLEEKRLTHLAFLAAITSLIVIHIFSPYINHPLGLGLMMLATIVFSTSYVTKTHSYN